MYAHTTAASKLNINELKIQKIDKDYFLSHIFLILSSIITNTDTFTLVNNW